MKHLAAYALLVLGGKENPKAADVEKLLKDAGCKADSDKVKDLIEKMKDKKFHETAEAGLKKMSAMGSAAGPATASAGAGKTADAPKEEEVKEEEEDVDMGGLFGDDDDY
jgi:large subunit ribosomal protein LP2